MIRLKALKEKRAREKKAAAENGPRKKTNLSAAQLRVQADIASLNQIVGAVVSFPDPNDLMNFSVSISPQEGYWRGGKFEFSFHIPEGFPGTPPKIKCITRVYHPNIDKDGSVCLNILRDDYRPVFSIESIICGLQFLFSEPNGMNPLNEEAGELLKTDKAKFGRTVSRSLEGGYVGGTRYHRNMHSYL